MTAEILAEDLGILRQFAARSAAQGGGVLVQSYRHSHYLLEISQPRILLALAVIALF